MMRFEYKPAQKEEERFHMHLVWLFPNEAGSGETIEPFSISAGPAMSRAFAARKRKRRSLF
jgi:hypothetical protein